VFLGRKTYRVPTRTFGALLRDPAGHLALHYRPWLVLPARTLVLPPGPYFVAKGLFYSAVASNERDNPGSLLLLPPRYRAHEAALAAAYGFAGVREAGVLAALLWLKDLLGLKAGSHSA
jgi:hypothetical protein